MKAHDLSGIRYQDSKAHDEDEIAIIVSKWNAEVTDPLYEGAVSVLTDAGVSNESIFRLDVPGSYELAAAAGFILEKYPLLDGVICLGCVIQGETRHFEFISQAAAQGIMQVGLKHNKPVIFGVLTPDTMQQALDRAGGKYGNKGAEAAVALLEMIDLQNKIESEFPR